MRERGEVNCWGVFVRSVCALAFFVFFTLIPVSFADLGPENVLLLVNGDSPTSQYVARMYRQYYPAIQDDQVLVLSGLPDCGGSGSGPEDEIISRQQYNTYIAEPVRQYIIAYDLFESVKVIVTTAGLPYRINDSDPNYIDRIVKPRGSDYTILANDSDAEQKINAASVESELTCLWYVGYGPNAFSPRNRIVNPYQGCRSSFDDFERLAPIQSGLIWSTAWSKKPGIADPLMEGEKYAYGTINRGWGPEHIYLVCRLDGPKNTDNPENKRESAAFSVREMLERSCRASDPQFGVNPNQAFILIDDAPGSPFGNVDDNRVFNLHDESIDSWEYIQGQTGTPDAFDFRYTDDYIEAFFKLLDGNPIQDEGYLNFGTSDLIHGIPVFEDYRTNVCMSASEPETLLNQYFPGRQGIQSLAAYCCFGCNGDEGRGSDYLICAADGGVLSNLVNGAVFTSLESFNAVTMFLDLETSPVAQGKIIDFIEIGGSGAIGHIFEPQADATIDNEFFFYNYFTDKDGPDGQPDGIADLTFVEAAFSGIPYLSWAEVAIGDPLMRIAYGTGDSKAWKPLPGDINKDGAINVLDIWQLRDAFGSTLQQNYQNTYNDLADLNQDGSVDVFDIWIFRDAFYNQ